MKVEDVVGFRRELFFDGAVQLRWHDENPRRAADAASHFIFHGPRYHGADADGDRDTSYALKDTATFATEIAEAAAKISDQPTNPFTLAIAGYGSGKSHLALTLASLFSGPGGAVAQKILANAAKADATLGRRLGSAVTKLGKPMLIVTLDGMANFHLGSEFARSLIRALTAADCDLTPIEDLSPRFSLAEEFVERNWKMREAEFRVSLPKLDPTRIAEALRERNEDVYEAVDRIYEEANGTRIPVDGRESIQDMVTAANEAYCGIDGPFAGILVIFDELGRFLEYAAESPHLAGDSALQQLFQGIQDNPGTYFLGFIQYELKAYISRLDRRDLVHLQRYITRFETARKVYLSTNLETLFAHLIEKRAPEALTDLAASGEGATAECHGLMKRTLRGIARLPVWSDDTLFRRVIASGCWPLHPLSTWFLTRQQDVVQSRSALIVIRDAISRCGSEATTSVGCVFSVPPADLVLGGMLPELVAAERAKGGTLAETLQVVLEERGAHLGEADRRVLAGTAVLVKLGVKLQTRQEFERMLAFASGVGRELVGALKRLVDDMGILVWNQDYGQFEIVQDAATRGQFVQAVRAKMSSPDAASAGKLFIGKGKSHCNLQDIDPGFGSERKIHTKEWVFTAMFADSVGMNAAIETAFGDWAAASGPTEAKGRIVYVYVGENDDLSVVTSRATAQLTAGLVKTGVKAAPIWLAFLHDADGRLAECLLRVWVLEHGLSKDDRERFRRFVDDEQERARSSAQQLTQSALSARRNLAAGMAEVPAERQAKVGAAIFAKVYPSVLPYPFDGFIAVGGGGMPDSMEAARILFLREFTDEWIQASPTKRRSRVTALLVNSWQIMDASGRVAFKPGNPAVAALLDEMDKWHENEPRRKLSDTIRSLILPPYGMNTASATVLLGLFASRERPLRRLEVDGTVVSTPDWVGQSFKNNGLIPKQLARTTIRYIAENSDQRWRGFLMDWKSAVRHSERVGCGAKSRDMLVESPVPDELVSLLDRLQEQARQSAQELEAFEVTLDTIQRQLDEQCRKEFNGHGLKLCDDLLALVAKVKGEAFDQTHRNEAAAVLTAARDLVNRSALNWIKRQNCLSPVQVGEYRNRITKAAVTLKNLGFAKLADQAEQQMTTSIASVNERHQFMETIVKAREFAKTAVVNSTMSIRELEERIAEAEGYVARLKQAGERIQQGEDIKDILAGLAAKVPEFKKAISERKEWLNALSEAQVASHDDAAAAIRRIDTLRSIFADKPKDIGYLDDMRGQLERIKEDLATWSSLSGSPEEVGRMLESAIPERSKALEAWCEEHEIDPVWDFAEVYSQFRERHVRTLEDKSGLWADTRMSADDEIATMTVTRAKSAIAALANPPAYLSSSVLEAIKSKTARLEQRVSDIAREELRRRAETWFTSTVKPIGTTEGLTRDACERLLPALRSVPVGLTEPESASVENIRRKVEARIDEIDLTDIITRIERLSPAKRKEIIRRLQEADSMVDA